jgi:PST family polysaccharide transporter
MSSLLITAAGTFLQARFIGPANYGIYVSAATACVMLARFTELGLTTLLMSETGDLDRSTVGHAVAVSMSVAVAGTLVAVITAWTIDRWIPLGKFLPAFLAMVPGVMLVNLSGLAIMLLERALDYRRVALAEMIFGLTASIAGVAVAFFVRNFWALVCVFWMAHLLLFGLVVFYVRDVFRPVWNVPAMVRLAWDSLPFAAIPWVTQIRDLVNPIVVGTTLGAGAVGVVALALRLITAVGAMREIIRRLALPGLRRLIGDEARLRAFAETARNAQIGLVGLPLLAFSFMLPLLQKWAIGRSWDDLFGMYPLLAIAYLVGSFSVLPVCVLVILQKRKLIVLNSAAQFLTLIGTAAVLTPRIGIMGYGVAEIVSAFAAFIAVASARRLLGPLGAKLPILASVAIGAGFAWIYIGPVALTPLALLPLSRRVRQFVTRSIAQVRALRSESSSN